MVAVSLIDGPVPWLVGLTAVVAFVAGLVGLGWAWCRRWLPWLLGGSVLITMAAVYGVHHVGGLIGDETDEYPMAVNVIAGCAVVAVGTTAASWRQHGWDRRVLTGLAAVLLVVFAGDQLAIRYGYPADLTALFNLEVPGATPYTTNPSTTIPSTTVSSTTPTSLIGPARSAPTAPFRSTAGPAPASSTNAPTPTTTVAVTTTVGPGASIENGWQPPLGLPAHGQVLADVTIPATVSGFAARTAYVYLPPAYTVATHPALPVLVLLPGIPGQPKNWLVGLDAHHVYDEYAAHHHGLAPILVFPDYTGGLTDDKGCIDSPEGAVETYLTRDVPAFIQATFAPASGPAC